jgi:hypothetical protein
MIAMQAHPSGPGMLVISKTIGTDYVQFSTFARCEAAKRDFDQRQREYSQRLETSGYTVVGGTMATARCIPG